MVAPSVQPPDNSPQVSLEHRLGAALGEMRTLAAEERASPDYGDDYWTTWEAEVMDRQPLVFVAAFAGGQVLAWLMDPNNGGVLSAVQRGTGRGCADFELMTKTHADIMDGVSWLVKELTGDHLPKASS